MDDSSTTADSSTPADAPRPATNPPAPVTQSRHDTGGSPAPVVPDADNAGVPSAETAAQRQPAGPKGPEPTRYGDWEVGGLCSDF